MHNGVMYANPQSPIVSSNACCTLRTWATTATRIVNYLTSPKPNLRTTADTEFFRPTIIANHVNINAIWCWCLLSKTWLTIFSTTMFSESANGRQPTDLMHLINKVHTRVATCQKAAQDASNAYVGDGAAERLIREHMKGRRRLRIAGSESA